MVDESPIAFYVGPHTRSIDAHQCVRMHHSPIPRIKTLQQPKTAILFVPQTGTDTTLLNTAGVCLNLVSDWLAAPDIVCNCLFHKKM